MIAAAGLAGAARHGLALQHDFATPPTVRLAVEARYDALRGDTDRPGPAHLHTLVIVVADDVEQARAELAAALTASFRAGDHPMVPQAPDHHVAPDGTRVDPADRAARVAETAIVGPPGLVVDRLGAFIARTGARRLALYHEAIADPARTLASLGRFATEVAPPAHRGAVSPVW